MAPPAKQQQQDVTADSWTPTTATTSWWLLRGSSSHHIRTRTRKRAGQRANLLRLLLDLQWLGIGARKSSGSGARAAQADGAHDAGGGLPRNFDNMYIVFF